MQFFLHPGRKCRHQQDGNNTATPRRQRIIPEDNLCQSRMGENRCHHTTNNRRTAEFLRGIDTDKKIHAKEDRVAHDSQQFDTGHICHRRIDLQQDIERSCDQAAGNEARNQWHKYPGNPLEQQFDWRRILLADRCM